jgi:hypothetical protein
MLATCAVAASGPLALTISAGAPSSTSLFGLRTGNVQPGAPADGVPLEASVMDLASGAVQLQPIPQFLDDGVTPVFTVDDSVTGYSVLPDGTHLIAITPVPGSKGADDPTRLVRVTGSAASRVPVSGLNQQEQLGSLASTSSGPVLALAHKKNGAPPARLVRVDPASGAANDYPGVQVPGNALARTLTVCPNGVVYATATTRSGDTSLVRLDTNQSTLLKSGGVVWNNGLASLVCSPTNELVALGAPRYKGPNGVYTIDPSTGVMTLVREFNVDRLTLAHL